MIRDGDGVLDALAETSLAPALRALSPYERRRIWQVLEEELDEGPLVQELRLEIELAAEKLESAEGEVEALEGEVAALKQAAVDLRERRTG